MREPKKPFPATTARGTTPAEARSSSADVQAFLEKARRIVPSAGGKGRLILALDATMSRQPTWDLACELQAKMFDSVGDALGVQLVYFRGAGECRASRFVNDASALKDLMVRIDCRGGHTQIGKVFSHALKADAEAKVNAVVFIGDAMEESIDDLCEKAGRLGLKGIPVFLFQEGRDAAVETAFREFARLSRGAWFRFDRSAPATLSKLLETIAVYATGGLKALEARGTAEDRLLLENLAGRRR